MANRVTEEDLVALGNKLSYSFCEENLPSAVEVEKNFRKDKKTEGKAKKKIAKKTKKPKKTIDAEKKVLIVIGLM